MGSWLSDAFLTSQTDERLVALVRAGHDRAFSVVVARYQRQLHAVARRISPDGGAEDLVQQTFLSAFTALEAGVEVRHLRGWLHQILRNTAARAPRPPEFPTAEPRVMQTPSAQQLAEARLKVTYTLTEMARLPDRQREALVQTAIQGRSRAEVAATLGVSQGAVRQLVHRARDRLRAAVAALTPYPLVRALTAMRDPCPGMGASDLVAAGAASATAGSVKAGALMLASLLGGAMASDVLPDRHHARLRRQGVGDGSGRGHPASGDSGPGRSASGDSDRGSETSGDPSQDPSQVVPAIDSTDGGSPGGPGLTTGSGRSSDGGSGSGSQVSASGDGGPGSGSQVSASGDGGSRPDSGADSGSYGGG